jgi:hypothetical protein
MAAKIPAAGVDLDGAVTINDSGAAVDFRLEGDTEANLFFVDGSEDKVGIGTNSPGQLLEVRTDQNTDTAIKIKNDTGGTAARSSLFLDVNSGGLQIMAIDDGFTTSGVYRGDAAVIVADTSFDNGMNIGTRSSNGNAVIRIYTQDSEKMRVNATGGILLTCPVTGVYGIDNQITPSSGNVYGQKNTFENHSPDNNTSSFYWGNDNVTARFGVYSDGDVINHDNSYGAISDERIKQDIRDSNSQWDDIKAVKVRNFKKKDDVRQYGDKAWEQIGVIAQELEAAGMDKLIKHGDPSAADIISSSEFGTLNEDGTIKEIKTQVKKVGYSVLYMKAIKALQEAMAKIEALETSNTDLKNRVTALEG